MSLLLKRLETAGLVSRDRLATDERTVVVSLTDKGAAPRAPGRDPHGDRLHAGAGATTSGGHSSQH
ncbi:transcriptional regulator, SarA/Rot family [Kibdelosporangium aridum]|uniref:transcriptional regulator, SarA/Rot family n=1 Tax=Kibdelosporangium aridum TaxID=2030 RepID=UPI0021AE0454|nr:winged helix DNA-binding protein [Kibdelosporangium aridum]